MDAKGLIDTVRIVISKHSLSCKWLADLSFVTLFVSVLSVDIDNRKYDLLIQCTSITNTETDRRITRPS